MDEDGLDRLLGLLDADAAASVETSGTSVRLPVPLREAAALATEMGLISSTTGVTVRGLRAQLDHVVRRAALDSHYERYPETRPELWELAKAAADLTENPLAAQPELLRRAADEWARLTDDPTPAEVLAYASGLASAAA